MTKFEAVHQQCPVISNREVAHGHFVITFESQLMAGKAQPGQFLHVRCGNGYEPLLRRPLSVHRVTGDRKIHLLYKVVGRGTGLLSGMKAGELLDVMGPLGRGFSLERGRAVLVGGGMGVAPLVCLAQKLRKNRTEFSVILGARSSGGLLCEKEMRELAGKVMLATEDGSRGLRGTAVELLEREFSARGTGKGFDLPRVYACGPHAMLRELSRLCNAFGAGCEGSLETFMACGTGVCYGCSVSVRGAVNGYMRVCADGPVFDLSKIIWE